MSGENNIAVLLDMQDNATPKLRNAGDAISALGKRGGAFREMAQGASYLGGIMLTLGATMKATNIEAMDSVSKIMMISGAAIMAVGTTAQFVSAIGKMVRSLRILRTEQILTQALSGPAGWATLAAGVAVAGGTIYGMNKMSAPKSSTNNAQVTNVNIYNAGSVITERQMADSVQKQLLDKKGRNNGVGF